MFFGRDEKAVAAAVKALSDGKLVAIPTETVYGLAANALSAKAVERIYKAKGRPSDNPLIIHVADICEVEKYAYFTKDAERLAERFWPGPLTMILKKKPCVPDAVTAGMETVAVRMPDNTLTREIIRKAGFPLAAPSANLSGRPSPTEAKHVYDDYNGKVFSDGEEAIAGIIDGGVCNKGVESTIILLAAEHPVLLRPGVITFEELKEFLPDLSISPAVVSELKKGEKPLSPGMVHRHYSPSTPTVGICGKAENIAAYLNTAAKFEKIAAMCFEEDINLFSNDIIKLSYGKKSDPETLAKNLFSVLRTLDASGADKIYAETEIGDGIYLAVYNRLIRACGFTVIDADIPPVSVCITGPSGAGKSSVCASLVKAGFQHIDGDKTAAEILPTLKEELVSAFGSDIIGNNGDIDRAKLAAAAFSSEENTKILNNITHPAIKKKMMQITADKTERRIPVLIDGAAIFEAGLNHVTDFTVTISAPECVRKKRILERDNISEEMINLRFSRQKSDDFYKLHSDLYLINDGNTEISELKDEIINFIKGGKK